MSKYESICTAIDLCEVAKKIFAHNVNNDMKAEIIIRDLQNIAKDVRYGGKWEGGDESLDRMADEMDICAMMKHPICKRNGNPECSKRMKQDAAAALRYASQRIRELEEQIAKGNQQGQ